MTQVPPPQQLLQELEGLLESRQLPPQPARHGLRLLEKALVPVTVAVVGLPGSGKSQVINLLCGRELFTGAAPCPSLEVSWGETEQTVLEFSDGSHETCDGIVTQLQSTPQPVTARITAPLPALKRVTLLELPSPQTPRELQSALQQAVRRADIILWCSQGFSDAERALWAQVPDEKKDHSFFVLTKADTLSQTGQLSARITALQNIVADEFHSLIPVATRHAVMARTKGDAPALVASGGKALITTVAREVDNGRRAYFDGILLFLRRYSAVLAKNGQISAHISAQTGDGAATPDGADAANLAAKHAPVTPDDVSDEIIFKALENLQKCGEELARLNAATEDVNARILEHCSAVSNEIADMFSTLDNVSLTYSQIQTDALETADIVLLMQLEGGAGPAADAVSVLLQLRRGLAARAAA